MKSKKIFFKLIFDLLMFVTLMILYKKNVISLAFHEIAGLILLGAMLIHVLINGNWVKAVSGKLFQKGFSAKQKVNWVVDFLELITVIGMIVTSLLINKRTFPAIGNHRALNPYHFFLAAVLLVLVGIHLGLHFTFIKNSISSSKQMKTAVKGFFISLGMIVSGFGCYSLFSTSFPRWLKAPFVTLANAHPERPGAGGGPGFGPGGQGQGQGLHLQAFSFTNLLMLFVQMASIALLFGIIAFVIQTIISKNKSKRAV